MLVFCKLINNLIVYIYHADCYESIRITLQQIHYTLKDDFLTRAQHVLCLVPTSARFLQQINIIMAKHDRIARNYFSMKYRYRA